MLIRVAFKGKVCLSSSRGEFVPELAARPRPEAGVAFSCQDLKGDVRGGLIKYGERKRQFKTGSHGIGQKAIDAFEDQVLRPGGARFVPPEDGREGLS